MRNQWRQVLLGFLALGLFGYGFYYLVAITVRSLTSLDQGLVVAILAASGTVLTATITVVMGRIFERKKETQAHFRQRKYDLYYDLLKMISEMTGPDASVNDAAKKLTDWQRNLILFADPKTIRHFVAWMSNLKSGQPTLRSLALMEEFHKALRADLGISNFGLADGDLVNLILRHGNLYVSMAKKNPDMPLTELVEMEKLLDAASGIAAVSNAGQTQLPQPSEKT